MVIGGSGSCYDIDLEVLSLIVSFISVFVGFSYCTVLLSLILKIYTHTLRMHSCAPMTSLCLLLYIVPRFPSFFLFSLRISSSPEHGEHSIKL